MTYLILKFGISAAVLVAVSEIARRSSFAGGLLASLPLTSLLAYYGGMVLLLGKLGIKL